MGSKINSNTHDPNSRASMEATTSTHISLKTPSDSFRFSVIAFLFPHECPTYSCPDVCETIKPPTTTTGLNTFACESWRGGRELGFSAKTDKAASRLHIGTVVIQLKGAHTANTGIKDARLLPPPQMSDCAY